VDAQKMRAGARIAAIDQLLEGADVVCRLVHWPGGEYRQRPDGRQAGERAR
jgi:hypothetical protein